MRNVPQRITLYLDATADQGVGLDRAQQYRGPRLLTLSTELTAAKRFVGEIQMTAVCLPVESKTWCIAAKHKPHHTM